MSDFHLYAERERIATAISQFGPAHLVRCGGIEDKRISEFEQFGPAWTLREAKRLAFEYGVDDGSRITALRDLLRDVR